MVIVDEEHDDSYKQDETPRYHGRDVALVRAQLAKAVVVLGSATPSLETLRNVRVGKLTQLELSERPTGGALPAVEIVPLFARQDPSQPAPKRAARSGRELSLFSPALLEATRATVERGEQVILFLNRRGFAPFVICQSCGYGFRCAQCSVALTHHLGRGVLLCHYCGHAEPAPVECPSCRSPQLRTLGSGTERLELDLRSHFPKFRIGRLDRDVASRPEALRRSLFAFRRGDLDLLVGTQMVTKGHDFPNVTLVGVVFADASLNFPDFRAAERTAQLLVQVAGRSGRGDSAGRVIVQSANAEHPALLAARSHDYASFANAELVERSALGYPPFQRLILVRAESEERDQAVAACELLAARLRAIAGAGEVLGPAPCPLERLRGKFRVMLLLKGQPASALRQRLRSALAGFSPGKATKLVLDCDPVSML
jgi:primosomal protein N' (replication factor Y)